MFYRCPSCGSDKDLKVTAKADITYGLSNTGQVMFEKGDSVVDIGDSFNDLENVQCTNCGNEGELKDFALRSLTLLPSPESDDEDTIILTAVRADHIETCPKCHVGIDIICIGTNKSDEFKPTVMWCSCGHVWSNIS